MLNCSMCGRYSITGDISELEKLVKFICKVVDFKPRYNIAPRSHVPVLVSENGQNVLKEMRWGLIPFWAKDETIGDKLINARAEYLTANPNGFIQIGPWTGRIGIRWWFGIIHWDRIR